MTDARQTIIEELEKGRSLLSICKDEGMPSRETVRQWQKADETFDLAVTRAREDGFHYLAEQARIRAQTAEDAAKGRLAFDADRWYLGKLSNAFSDNKDQKHVHSGAIALKGIEIRFGRSDSAES
jgi:hypothetical protein